MAGEARNHHWIPQCYLKSFAKSRSKNAQLYVVDASSRKSFLASPRNVASTRDFNRIDVDGVDPNHIEARYADFESLVAPAVVRLDEKREFGRQEDHNLILNLIALLAIRNPRMRENSRHIQKTIQKRSIAGAVQAGDVPADHGLTAEVMREFIEGDRFKLMAPNTCHIEDELKRVDAILPLLGQRNWLLLRALPNMGGFITTDHPVCLDWIDRRERSLLNSSGFAFKGTEVLFPISQHLAMVGTFEDKSGALDVPAREVAKINTFIAAFARRQIYARDDRFLYAAAGGEVRRDADLLRDLPAPAGGA